MPLTYSDCGDYTIGKSGRKYPDSLILDMSGTHGFATCHHCGEGPLAVYVNKKTGERLYPGHSSTNKESREILDEFGGDPAYMGMGDYRDYLGCKAHGGCLMSRQPIVTVSRGEIEGTVAEIISELEEITR